MNRFIHHNLHGAVLGLAAMLALPAVATPQQTDAPTDMDVTDAVEDELLSDHAINGYTVEVDTDNGVVTLTGYCDSILAMERAADIARTVKGVRSVVNRVEVRPPATLTADKLKADVESALLTDPATDSYEILVTADAKGHVGLTGDVQSWTERELCGLVARSVAGVTSLDNNIQVDYQTERPDIEIQREVEAALRWNALVDDGLIRVEVKDGEVTLRGTVGSAAEAALARTEAWVAGVKRVDADPLAVARWARDDDLRGSKYVVRTDAEIHRALVAALRQDPRVASFQVVPTVERGRVTLRGTVDNLMARRAAERDARNTVGVVHVDSRLRVRPAADRPAAAVTQDIRDALLRDPFVNRYEVSVRVANGTAHLYGSVDTAFERARAEDVTARVNGVIDVVNHLLVSDDGIVTYDPYVDPWPIHAYPWYRYDPPVTFRTDREIHADIEDELWWSPFVDSDQVAVKVVGGVATLTGTVDSWSERAAATENAYEGGATWVNNQLEVARSDQ